MLREKWFKRRCYLHFDAPISYLKAKQLVEDPKKVACWSFFPLLHVTLDSKKIVRAEDNSLKFKEKKEISTMLLIVILIFIHITQIYCVINMKY